MTQIWNKDPLSLSLAGIPSSSKADAAFAQKHGIDFIQVLGEDGHTLVNSEQVRLITVTPDFFCDQHFNKSFLFIS